MAQFSKKSVYWPCFALGSVITYQGGWGRHLLLLQTNIFFPKNREETNFLYSVRNKHRDFPKTNIFFYKTWKQTFLLEKKVTYPPDM